MPHTPDPGRPETEPHARNCTPDDLTGVEHWKYTWYVTGGRMHLEVAFDRPLEADEATAIVETFPAVDRLAVLLRR